MQTPFIILNGTARKDWRIRRVTVREVGVLNRPPNTRCLSLDIPPWRIDPGWNAHFPLDPR